MKRFLLTLAAVAATGVSGTLAVVAVLAAAVGAPVREFVGAQPKMLLAMPTICGVAWLVVVEVAVMICRNGGDWQ